MQNIDLKSPAASGTLKCPYNAQTLQGYLDLEDLASITQFVLLDPAPHNRARYELVGQNCTFEDLAEILGKTVGKQIKCEHIPREMVLGQLKGEEEYTVEGVGRMYYYYETR